MSKKHKIHKKPNSPVPAKPAKGESFFSKFFGPTKHVDSKALIIFDNKVKIFLILMVALYFIMGFAKLHTSSVAVWDMLNGIRKPSSVIAGTPRGIRQDEWMLGTPELIGRYRKDMPPSEAAVGDSVTVNSRVSFIEDMSKLLQPKVWPYYIFDIERAFAFSWNFTIFAFLISVFLLFLLLTGSNFWISLFGAVFLFLSGGLQWWSYWLGSNMIFFNVAVLAFIYLLYSKNQTAVIIAGAVFLLSSFNVLTSLYAPWQVPLMYLYVAIFFGYMITKKDLRRIKEKMGLRALVFSAAFLCLAFFMYNHYLFIKDTTEVLLNTVYPGKRTTTGGDLVAGKLFSEFFGMYLSESSYPKIWLNICEASSFIMFFPIVFYGMAINYFKEKKFDWMLILLSAYVLVILAWIVIGFPVFLSKASLLSMSPAYRTLPVLGVANVILLICWLGRKETKSKSKVSWMELGLLTAGIIAFMWFVTDNISTATSNFFISSQVTTVTVLMTAVYLLIRYKNIKYATPLMAVILLGMTLPNIKIHPLTKGLSSVLKNPLVLATQDIQKQDPKARWAVFGNQRVTNLLKANNINVFNGRQSIPPLKDMAVLDPSGRNSYIYNRYAHINMNYLIDMNDSILFKLNENEVVNDNYSIYMDPCSPRLPQIGVKYFLFTEKPIDLSIRCMTLVKEAAGMYIYKREKE